MSAAPTPLNIAGRLAALFQNNPLTPVLALAGLILGLIAIGLTPREEEPQIDVTMADVIVPLAGASSGEIEQWLAQPLEQNLAQIEGVKHVYSQSSPGRALVTVEFAVGVPRQTALVRLYDQVFSHQDWLPQGLGAGPALIKPKGIDDVPVMSLTLWSQAPDYDASQLAEIAHSLEGELKRIPGTRDIYSLGAPERSVLVTLDSRKLAAFNLTAHELIAALQAANAVSHSGARITNNAAIELTAGQFLSSAREVADLVIGYHQGQPVRLADVAQIKDQGDLPSSLVWYGAPATQAGPNAGSTPAITLVIAKKPGSNASSITQAVKQRIEQLRGELIPPQVQVTVTRDYGQSAADKAHKLIEKLLFATASVVLLVLFSLGRREAVVVGSAVILTLAVTLFASWAMGFTLNRVSLFALIFSIGILVDDAVVIVENIHRHLSLRDAQGRAPQLSEVIAPAVAEVGGPTILATFTVMAALLPMAFVSGLMGPYMRPIPINASAGMLLSLLIALTVTPWLALKLLRPHTAHSQPQAAGDSRLSRFFHKLMQPFLVGNQAPRKRVLLYLAMALLVMLAASLAAAKLVVLKMLPFDNKSELQLLVDLPEGGSLERTNALLQELASVLDQVPEVLNYQGYAGTSAPINFNGLVRQYYLRQAPNLGDVQINLVDKHQRTRQSHAIALNLRPLLEPIAARYQAALKVVEVPPGPPVLAPLVAELYGPDYAGQKRLGQSLLNDFFHKTADLVDSDSTVEAFAKRQTLVVDRIRAARLGVSQTAIRDALQLAVSGTDASFIHDGRSKYPRPIRLRLPASDQADLNRLLNLKVRAGNGALIALSELVQLSEQPWDGVIYHKDGLPVVYITGDQAGALDSPLYGMFSLVSSLKQQPVQGVTLTQHFIEQPQDSSGYAIKWDGEWQITYETFRDMGLAYAAGMLLIYLLLVAQFKSYGVPLIIMAPIPLTLIGVMPGHALFGAQFTATSMIGMIALAGIIVRNSILLVDFIDQLQARGVPLAEAVIESCSVRAKPIALTAVAAMLGALFILDDPIFNGLAISLIFGIAISTLLTLVVIPLLYYGYQQRR